MIKPAKFYRIIAIATIIVIGLAGCATYVPIKSVRAPTIDTSNMQRMAIRPFENKSGVGGVVGAQLTQYLTDKARQIIPAAGMFTIVAPTDPNADGIFTGEIRSIESRDSQESRERKDREGNPYTEITYNREVSIEFTYSVISTRTDMPVGTVTKRGSTSASSTRSAADVTDTLTLAKGIVDTQMRQLHQDIVPTIVSTSRKLMNETSKDKVVKDRMKMALALVKNRNYQEAIRQYDEINREYGSIAARTNADILRESIASDVSSRARLTELFNDTGGLTDKAVNSTNDTLNLRLPSGTTIMIMKTSSTEVDMLDIVVDQLTKTVVQTGSLKVVDRSNQALIHAEQQFQLSGYVSDDTVVSIGHQLGVQYIVLCWISGERSLRRFNFRVLNVETAQIIHQADYEI